MNGDSNQQHDLLIRARSVLLDALEALFTHRRAVVVIGAQAIYLHTGGARVALAEATKDSDLALDVRLLGDDPRIEDAMRDAGFRLDAGRPQPGTWLSRDGIPVDLMVPETLSGSGGRRGARIPPHANWATRRATGLEAAVVDHQPMIVEGLAPEDRRAYQANVAGPAALLIAKLFKLGERQTTPSRLVDKDAHDLYRLLVAVPTESLASSLAMLRADPFAGQVTHQAIGQLVGLFATGPEAIGSVMAGRAEEGIGDPVLVATAVSLMAADLAAALTDAEPRHRPHHD